MVSAGVGFLRLRPCTVAAVPIITLARLALLGVFVGNLGRLPAFSTGERTAPILVSDLLAALLLTGGGLVALQKRSLQLDSVALLGVAFAAVGGASTLLSIPRFDLTTFETLVSLGYLARWTFYFSIYVVLINVLKADDVLPLWRFLESILLAFAIFGIVQSLILPDFAQIVYPASRHAADWDLQGHRLISTWLDPNYAGAFLVLGLLVYVAQVALGQRIALWKPAVLGIALLLTVSRGALLAFAVGLGVLVLLRGLTRRLLGGLVALVLLLIFGLPSALYFTGQVTKLTVDVSALHRVVAWMRAAQVFAEHPIIGIGFNAWGFVQERYGYLRMFAYSYALDGGLIFVALMTGVVGLAIYVGMLLAVMRRARRIYCNPDIRVEHRAIALGTSAGVVALVVSSLFTNSLFQPFLMETQWVLWALVFVIASGGVDGRGGLRPRGRPSPVG